MGSVKPDQHAEVFPDLPPFSTDVLTAPLLRLSLPALRTSDEESIRLWSAATNLGFFYLDLRDDTDGEQLLKEADELFISQRSCLILAAGN